LQYGKHKHDHNDSDPVISGWIREVIAGEVISLDSASMKLPNVVMDHIFYDIQHNEDEK